MTTKYKANLTKLNGINNSKKLNHCMLTISVGQEVHEKEKFKATLKLINDNFQKCSIGVCDTLQRHSLAILSDSQNDNLYDVSEEAGDQWIRRNIEYCNQILKIPFKMVRWDEWLKKSKYQVFRKKVDQLFEQDETFISIVNDLVIDFNNRLKKRGHSFDLKKGIKFSTEYILEECAAMCHWYEEEYDVEVYPSVRNKAIEYSFSRIMPEQYGKLVLPAGVHFKRICT